MGCIQLQALRLVVLAVVLVACGPSQTAGGPCTLDADCDDGNPCTDDQCTPEGTCATTANSAPCDDGNACTENDICRGSVCTSGINACPCATDGDCAPFEDQDLCNGSLVCGDDDRCVIDSATVVTCPADQDTQCTKSRCDPLTGACALRAETAGTACDDGSDCTGGDSCQGGACIGAEETCCGDQLDNDGDTWADCDDAECAGNPACEDSCPALAPIESAPLPPESLANTVESTNANGFADDYVYNQAGTIKIGTRRDWGGSIIFFGTHDGNPGLNASNAIDSADTGREVQIALYDVDRWYQNCAWNASCNANPSPTACPEQMVWLGWNPVQGGNRCNNGSGIDDIVLGDGASTIKTTPLYWNPHWDRTDCNDDACGNPAVNQRRSDVQVEQRVRFVKPNVVELSYLVTNLAALDHAPSIHEFPTVYTAFGRNGTPDLHRLFDASQNQVAIDTQAPGDATFRYKNFTSAGGWVSLQNTSLDYGVGLYYENGISSFQAWQSDDPDFNNVRAMFSFGLPAFGQVRARSYLILGSLATVAAEAQWLSSNLSPFGSLDVPASSVEVTGTVTVQGWALDNRGVAAVELIVDGGTPIPLSYGGHRPDVCLVWPGYPACASNNVGYAGSFDANALSPDPCGHVLEVRATDTDGNRRTIARRRVYLAD